MKTMSSILKEAMLVGTMLLFLAVWIAEGHNSGYEYIPAKFGELYTNSSNSSVGLIYHYRYNSSRNAVVRIETWMNDTSDYPLLYTVKQDKSVTSWELPYIVKSEIVYYFDSVARTMCPNYIGNYSTLHDMHVEVSTFCTLGKPFAIQAFLLSNFTLAMDKQYSVWLSPAKPEYYEFTFPPGVKSAFLKATSEQPICAVVSIQTAQCPVSVENDNVLNAGKYQTMLSKSGITFKKAGDQDKVFVVFVIRPSEYTCDKSANRTPDQDLRNKTIQFIIEPVMPVSEYVFPMVMTVAAGVLVWIVILSIIGIKRCVQKETSEKRVKELHDNFLTANESRLEDMSEPSVSAPREEPDELDGNDVSLALDADRLQDVDNEKHVYRMKRNLKVSDMCRKGEKKLTRRYLVYFWNMTSISVFYALPVAQLVLTYQQVLNSSGDEDTCYYNFYCSRPLLSVHNFNNVFSNMGYIMFGALFLLVAYLRHRKYERLREEYPNYAQNHGIPRHLGLYFTMGWALIVEGVMSACYHVCPSYSNFQFDTAFMYIIAGVLMIQIFQSRHPDINTKAHLAFLTFAGVIGLGVLGVRFNSITFWVIFTLIHLAVTIAIIVQVYYLGTLEGIKGVCQVFNDMRLYCASGFCKSNVVSRNRFVFAMTVVILNVGFAIVGLVERPGDFASYFLAIFIVNLFMYCCFYVLMKIVNKECPSAFALIYGVLAVICWVPALYFFFQSLTNWEVTPAQSRDGNKECILMDFYDDHDIWHFLSSIALFFSFMMVFHLDDYLMYTKRTEINVF